MSWLSNALVGNDETRLGTARRATHTYVIGQPGTGKSRALEAWALQDIAAGHGVAIIDPHGDLFRSVLRYLSARPETWERVVILDPCDPKWVTGFNPLAAVSGMPQERLASLLTDVITKIWKLDSASTPRLLWLLTNTFVALASLNLTLLDLPRFLTDTGFRESLLPRLTNEGARAYFTHEFPNRAAAIQQWASPALTRLGSLVFDPEVRLMVAGKSKLDFRAVMDRRLILLAHLPKGIIGEGTSALLGAFIVAHMQKAALSRTDTAARRPFYLYLDEFQNYTTDNIQDILSESRKYNLSLILAHQYLDQLSSELRSAVLNTAGTVACFRVGYHDAYQLAKEVFPSPDFLDRGRRGFSWSQPSRTPFSVLDEHHRSLGWEGHAQALANLRPREFWVRQRGPMVPTKLRSLDVPDVDMTPLAASQERQLREAAGRRFGALKAEVRDDVAARAPSRSQSTGSSPVHRAPTDSSAWSD